IQEYTGFVAPGIVAVFLLGFFWKRANTAGAFALLVSSVVLSFLFFAAASPDAVGTGLSNGVAGALAPVFNPLLGLADFSVTDMPFVVRIWFIFLICLLVGVVASLLTTPPRPEQPVDLSDINFDTTTGFKVSAAFIIAILVGLYALLW
ncbi:MAG: sodium transporter, partial [Henriciella sp.]